MVNVTHRASFEPHGRPTSAKRLGLALGLLILLVGSSPARAEEGLVNAHLSLGAGILANAEVGRTIVDGVQPAGLDFSLKVDVPVHRWVAPQIGYGLIYLPGRDGAEAGVNMVTVGARVRILNDEKGYLANLWPKLAAGNVWGNLWVELGLGYAHAPTESGSSDWFALELGVGYEFSLAGPLQIGPYLSYRQLFVKKAFPAFVCVGVSVSFGWPRVIPKAKTVVRPRPQPRPNIVGRQGDRDGDAVGDGIDKCPSTPPGKQVDENGCEYIRGRMAFTAVRFKAGTTALEPGAEFALRRAAELIKAHPEVKVEVGAHTDSSGSAEDNLKLSLKQAQGVRDQLVRFGAPRDRIVVKGYGVTRPLDSSRTEQGRRKNRRIEFRFTVGQPQAD